MGLTDWDKLKEKKTKNIGFVSRANAFRSPSPAEVARAIMVETEAWQKTKGNKIRISAEYNISKGTFGINLLKNSYFDQGRKESIRLDAMDAYIKTPMGVPFERLVKQRKEYLIAVQTIIFIISLLFLVLIMRKGIK